MDLANDFEPERLWYWGTPGLPLCLREEVAVVFASYTEPGRGVCVHHLEVVVIFAPFARVLPPVVLTSVRLVCCCCSTSQRPSRGAA
jgi:hypothetical protein